MNETLMLLTFKEHGAGSFFLYILLNLPIWLFEGLVQYLVFLKTNGQEMLRGKKYVLEEKIKGYVGLYVVYKCMTRHRRNTLRPSAVHSSASD